MLLLFTTLPQIEPLIILNMELVDKKIVVFKALLLTIIAIIGIILYDVFINNFELIQQLQTFFETQSV